MCTWDASLSSRPMNFSMLKEKNGCAMFVDAAAGLDKAGGSSAEETGSLPADHHGLWLCVAGGRQGSQQGEQFSQVSRGPSRLEAS